MNKEDFEQKIRRIPLCVKCCIFMECKKNDVAIIYSHFATIGDLYECSHCKSQVITRFGAIFEEKEDVAEFKRIKNASLSKEFPLLFIKEN